jgi:hypothetical protein
MQQAGRNPHAQICESLNLFAKEVLPTFTKGREEREQRKQEELAPYIEAALSRKKWMKPLADEDIPIIRSSVEKVKFAETRTGAIKKA